MKLFRVVRLFVRLMILQARLVESRLEHAINQAEGNWRQVRAERQRIAQVIERRAPQEKAGNV